jgi:hypothetical protein
MALGNTLKAQNNFIGATKLYIQVLDNDIKHQHNEEWINEDIECLRLSLKNLGESKFNEIWCEVTGEECIGKLREAIWFNL